MPIEEILLKYKNKIIKKSLENNDIEESGEDLPGSSKESEKEKSSSSSTTVVDILTKTNGTDENKSEILESSSITNVNGTSNDDEQFDTQEIGAESSKIECGPSSSNGQNGSGQRSGTACLITDDSDDTDDDDEIFEVPIEGSNSESDDDGDDDDDDDDGDDDDDDDDSILIGADDEDEAGKDSGCTAVMALLVKNKLYVANAGDSRCVVSINGKAHDMSEDHKPEDEPELSRITAAGGRVSSDGRVNGGLNLSRALGDHNYKKNNDLPNTEQMITALPDVKVIDFTSTSSNSFLVLACDGIWNSLSSQDVVDFISEHINKPDIKLSSICEELFRTCLAPNTLSDGTGCDNMTCIIVKLKPQLKRPHYDVEEDDMSDGAEPKKPKSDST
uniref:protein-serine/threonine phosphatase n=1 Tax=Sipha flava TaxID=143950 RepID=A0A2S2QNS0_9HEMI